MLLAVDNHASKLAHRMALALLRPQDELQVVTVVSSEESRGFGAALLQPFLAQPLPSGRAAGGLVLVKGDERLSDVIAAHAEEGRADLVVCGSHHLCTTGEARKAAAAAACCHPTPGSSLVALSVTANAEQRLTRDVYATPAQARATTPCRPAGRSACGWCARSAAARCWWSSPTRRASTCAAAARRQASASLGRLCKGGILPRGAW